MDPYSTSISTHGQAASAKRNEPGPGTGAPPAPAASGAAAAAAAQPAQPAVNFRSRVTSAFLYVDDIIRSLEFYNEVVGAEVRQIHSETEEGEPTLAILRIGGFTLMLHPQTGHDEEFKDTRLGVGFHLQLQVDDIDAFYQHCLEQGAILAVSGEPVDQPWGWREFALKDPDGYVWSVYQDKTQGQWT
jgi:uncharacterized glyoxalase superfamily protein PhnB